MDEKRSAQIAFWVALFSVLAEALELLQAIAEFIRAFSQ